MSDVAVMRPSGTDIIEAVITKGDLSKLSPGEKTQYYAEVCRSVGLNPYTRPFEYISLNGKLVLYARKDCTDQLRKIHGINLEVISRDVSGDILTVHVRARDKAGRTDEDFGAVSIKNLAGEALANAGMKAVTKAKRRVTLSLSGLGYLDETEVEDIPRHERAAPTDTRAQLDAFASPAIAPATPAHDPDTGEIIDTDALERDARAAAARGTEILRGHLRGLSPDERRLLHDMVGTADEPGELLRIALQADGDALAERLRTQSSAASPPGKPMGYYYVTRQGDSSTDWAAWELAMTAMIDAGDDLAGILRDNRADLSIYEQIDQMRHHALMRALGVR